MAMAIVVALVPVAVCSGAGAMGLLWWCGGVAGVLLWWCSCRRVQVWCCGVPLWFDFVVALWWCGGGVVVVWWWCGGGVVVVWWWCGGGDCRDD